MKKLQFEKRDHAASSAAIADAAYYEVPEEIHVFSWSAEPPGTANAKCTQVHIHLGKPPGPVLLIRLKGPDTLDALVDSLTEHRENIWGKR